MSSFPALPFPARLIRDDLHAFAGYSSARTSHTGAHARIWLNANESGAPSTVDSDGSLRRYPDPQPADVVGALARQYGVEPAQVVVGRGSDEAIDLLVRTVCRPGGDGVVVTGPTFGMYGVSARLHGVPVVDVPQRDLRERWEVDVRAVAQGARQHGARVVFLASPGNPTGSVVPVEDVAWLTRELADRAVVVVDEAYQEFSSTPTAISLLAQHPTLVVLRTLSKAHALAGARVGSCLAHPDLAAVLRRVQAPYPVPAPVADVAGRALAPSALRATAERVVGVLRDRDRLAAGLRADPRVRATYSSEANFVLTRCTDPDGLLATLRAVGIVVRDMRHLPALGDALRVSVGTSAEVDAVVAALSRPLAATTRTTSTDHRHEPTPPVRTR